MQRSVYLLICFLEWIICFEVLNISLNFINYIRYRSYFFQVHFFHLVPVWLQELQHKQFLCGCLSIKGLKCKYGGSNQSTQCYLSFKVWLMLVYCKLMKHAQYQIIKRIQRNLAGAYRKTFQIIKSQTFFKVTILHLMFLNDNTITTYLKENWSTDFINHTGFIALIFTDINEVINTVHIGMYFSKINSYAVKRHIV